jgi:uncharacterized phiE125 gp8 family phage protein
MKFYSTTVLPPEESAVSLAAFKAFIRQDHDHEDSTLQILLDAAIVEAEGYVQTSLMRQTRRVSITGTPPTEIELDMGPVIEISSITYVDLNNTTQTIDEDDYVLTDNFVTPAPGKAWPLVSTQAPNGFRVTYAAGLIDTAVSPVATLQKNYVAAILLLAQIKYDRNPDEQDILEKSAYRLLDYVRNGQGV